ncbi:MAG: DUF4436 family protein [Terriglobia bacterium]|nr:DUF4436 family protein [Terriglobia bacterium]
MAGLLLVLLGIYFSVIWLNFTESARRSINLEIPSHGNDYLLIDVDLINVDLQRREMTARITFSATGNLAEDEVTPATDLQLVLNTVRGQQQITFPKGKRMNITEAVFPLLGEINRYPLDRYTGNVWLLATIPGRQGPPAPARKTGAKPAQKSKPPENKNVPQEKRGLFGIFSRGASQEQKKAPEAQIQQAPARQESPLTKATLGLGAAALTEQVQADTRIKFRASIPGLTFRGTELIEGVQSLKGLTGIHVYLKRSDSVISISALATVMMLGLSIGVVTMTVPVLSGTRKVEAFHATMAVSLIFGLPALRSIQPGIPSPGTLGDMLAFTWAEIAAATSVIALAIRGLGQGKIDVQDDRRPRG